MNDRIATLRPAPKGQKEHKLKKLPPPKVVKSRGGGDVGGFGLGGPSENEKQQAAASAHILMARLLARSGGDGGAL